MFNAGGDMRMQSSEDAERVVVKAVKSIMFWFFFVQDLFIGIEQEPSWVKSDPTFEERPF